MIFKNLWLCILSAVLISYCFDARFDENNRTILISDVKIAQKLLPETNYQNAIKIKIGTFEACPNKNDQLISAKNHPVIDALYFAFDQHRPISLSPDHIWLMICQGLANHIHVNSNSLQHLLVDFYGKKEIVIERNDFAKGSSSNAWEDAFAAFADSVKANIRGGAEFADVAFSTTGAVEKTAFQISLLNSYRDFFDLTLSTACGIPAIRLEGTVEDWRLILSKVQLLRKYKLEWWADELNPVLQQFEQAAQGKSDTSFWRSIFRIASQSGGNVINGWIIKFFPYIITQNGLIAINPLVNKNIKNFSALKKIETSRIWIKRDGYFEEDVESEAKAASQNPEYIYGLDLRNFSSGLSMTPFKWKYYGHAIDMEIFAGFIGIKQDHQTMFLRPEIGWAVREK